MAFYRQLLVFTVPSVAVLFGIYWYRRRRGFGNCDPGGNKRNTKTLKQELEDASSSDTKANYGNVAATPSKTIVKSAPIDIVPNGINSQRSSPIELTDKELDLEIEKAKSHKFVDMEYPFKKSSKENTPPAVDKHTKSLPAKSNVATAKSPEVKPRTSHSVKPDSVISCFSEQLLISKLNEESKDSSVKLSNGINKSSPVRSSISPIREVVKEEFKVDLVKSTECTIVKSVESDINLDDTNGNHIPSVDDKSNMSSNDSNREEIKIDTINAPIDKNANTTTKSDKPKNKKSRKSDKKSNSTEKKNSDKKQTAAVENVQVAKIGDAALDVILDKQSENNNSSDVNENLTTSVHSETEIPLNRDSANHSPCENMLASPSIGHFSDNHSEGSNDSGKGCSESPSPPPTNAGDVTPTANIICHQFYIQKSATGILIGTRKAFLQKLNSATNARVYVKEHPDSTKFNICVIEGTQQEIDIILDLIRQRLPERKFPNVSFKDMSSELCKSDYSSLADAYFLNLVEGVNNDAIISCYVSPSQLFLQQPMHPTYPSLHMLHNLMGVCYQDPTVPKLPATVTEGMICAAPTANNWYRTQVITTNTENNTSLVKLVDFGGFMDINNSLLKQIRGDFMLLPFQATEVQLAHVAPAGGDEWVPEAVQIVAGLTSGQLLQAQVVGYNEDGLPQVYLYLTLGPQQVISLNQELVVRGLAEWVDHEEVQKSEEKCTL